MLAYFSTELLKELLDYYLPRFRLAEERGFAVQGSKYAWLYDELRLRVSTIRQALLFLDSLPKFMECEDNSKPMQYVVSYTSTLFAPDGSNTVDRGRTMSTPISMTGTRTGWIFRRLWTTSPQIMIYQIYRFFMWICASMWCGQSGFTSRFGKVPSTRLIRASSRLSRTQMPQ